MIVSRRAVVMIRVIVPQVLVYVQRRRGGCRHDKSLSKQKCDQSAHGSSVLRPAETLRKMRRVSQLGAWTGSKVASTCNPFHVQGRRLTTAAGLTGSSPSSILDT